jgi:hypothetical protein
MNEKKDNKLLIRKVWTNKANGTKFITIPQDYEDIVEGDYVRIEKVEE